VEHLTDRVWLRSHEEETGPVRVYHPEGRHAFPPARGREGLVFHEDGRFDYLHSGRGDRPVGETGTWRLEAASGDRVVADVAGQPIELRIAEASPDVLRLEWLSP
jgi:hypothetical protein